MMAMKRLLSVVSGTQVGDPIDHLDEIDDAEVRLLARRYVKYFELERERLRMVTNRADFESLLGRKVSAAIGGAYVHLRAPKTHLILINVTRIDRSQPKALEVVVVEELMHMRDWIDGDRRRHAKHGYDRIAHRVAQVTGASLQEIRGCLLPTTRRPDRYVYRCPGCRRTVVRRKRGVWSCASCSPVFDRRFVLTLDRDLRVDASHE
jgi:predicted SprT family Zn-dependent metalloprotease